MGITMSGIQGLLAPLQSLMGWMANASAARSASRPHTLAAHVAAPRRFAPRAVPPGPCRERVNRPLRVVRVMDPNPARSGAGRLVISGRMADVCAELERLAAIEAAAG